MVSSIVFLPFLLTAAAAIKCGSNFCSGVVCPEFQNCEKGYLKTKGSYCGCCDTCITYIDEGKPCWNNMLLGVPVSSECKEELYCSRQTHTCERIRDAKRKSCTVERDEVKETQQKYPQLVGLSAPRCDPDGTYASVQCKESVCFCVDKDGYQLKNYGFNVGRISETDCKCAREEDFLRTLIGKRVSCDEIGNYRSLQCVGNACYCVTPKGGDQIGNAVNINEAHKLNC